MKIPIVLRKTLASRVSRDITVNGIVLGISKSIGFLVPIIIARSLGITSETDVFFFLFAIIMFFTMAVSSTLEGIVVPFLVGTNTHDQNSLINGLVSWSTVALVGVMALVVLSLEPAADIVTNFDPKQRKLLFDLSLLTIPIPLVIVYNSLLTSILVTRGYYIYSSLGALIRALLICGFLIGFVDVIGVFGIPLALFCGECVKLCVLTYYSYSRCLYRFEWVRQMRSDLKDLIHTGGYQFFSVLIVSFNPIVDKTIATWIVIGSLSILEYSEKILLVPVTFLSLGVTTILLPRWAAKFKTQDHDSVKREVSIASVFVLVGSMLIVVPMVMFCDPIVHLLFGGEISNIEASTIAISSIYYLIGVPFYVISLLLIRVLLAAKSTKRLALLSIIRFVLNLALDILLIQFYGVYGIAISSTLNIMILTGMLAFAVRETLITPEPK